MRFTKMEGLGNDYLYINTFQERVADPAALSVRLSDRHRGVGADGLVLIGPSGIADFSMRIFNADGSESEMCGNAARCVARYVTERGLWDRDSLTLETGGVARRIEIRREEGRFVSARVDMGRPVLSPAAIPVHLPGAAVMGLSLPWGEETLPVHCVSMGNPHCVLFVEEADTAPVTTLGPLLERHPSFPNRINVEFAQIVGWDAIRLRVWERGSGETQACGSGACAALVAGAITGRCGRSAVVTLPGGDLTVIWQPDGHVTQEGPAAFVFEGETDSVLPA